jgi:hypothetical protein
MEAAGANADSRPAGAVFHHRKISLLDQMRVLSYILIALGIYLLAAAFYQEYQGRTFKPAMLPGKATGMNANRGYLYSIPVLKHQNPELFRKFMVAHWIYAAVVEVGGCLLCLKTKQDDDL